VVEGLYKLRSGDMIQRSAKGKEKKVEFKNIGLEKCSASPAIKEIQIKTTLRFHLTPVRIAIIKNTTHNRGEVKS
jgi:hypothetical protein